MSSNTQLCIDNDVFVPNEHSVKCHIATIFLAWPVKHNRTWQLVPVVTSSTCSHLPILFFSPVSLLQAVSVVLSGLTAVPSIWYGMQL